MKCQTLAQLQPPSPDPLRILILAVLRQAVREAKSEKPTSEKMAAAAFLAEMEVPGWAEVVAP